MFFGIRQLRRARDLLGTDGRPGDRELAEAMLSFWAACDCKADWPAGFAGRAEGIRRRITADGSIAATAAGMSDAGLAALRDEILRFVADAEAHMPGAHMPGRSHAAASEPRPRAVRPK